MPTTILIVACQNGKLDQVKSFFKRRNAKNFINDTDDNGETALMNASKNKNNLEIVKELLKYEETIEGINLENNNGDTALDIATLKGNQEIADLLQSHGARRTVVHKKILDKFIGPNTGSTHDEYSYQIPLSQEFVKKTQYSFSTPDKLKEYEVYGSHIVFKCPVGHLHAPGECGVPTEIKTCNVDGCKYLVGGKYHYLVPGNCIVYHDGYEHAKLWYGNFPVNTYNAYLLMVKQYNMAVDMYNKENPEKDQLEKITPEKSKNQPGIASKILQNFEIPEDAKCSICTDEVKNDGTAYILPDCGHLIHEECLQNSRGGDLNNINDPNEENMNARKCGICNKQFRFGIYGKHKYQLHKNKGCVIL